MANTLILVHGFMDTEGRMAFLAKHFRAMGWKVLTPSLRPSDGSQLIEVLSRQLEDYVQQNTEAGERIDLIGFSMGGLICRYYLQSLGGLMKTDKLISISTPHQGTMAAYLIPGAGIQQMRPGSTFLTKLNSDAGKLHLLEHSSFYTPLDLMIIPARSSVLSPDRTYKCYALMHHRMVYHLGLADKIAAILRPKQ